MKLGCNFNRTPPSAGFKPSALSSAAAAQPHAHSTKNAAGLEQKMRIINIVDVE
jgi:hypothetical protein